MEISEDIPDLMNRDFTIKLSGTELAVIGTLVQRANAEVYPLDSFGRATGDRFAELARTTLGVQGF